MHRGDRGLHLVGSRASVAQSFLHKHEPFGNHLAVPQAAVLIFQEHYVTLGTEPRGRARMLQEQQRGEPHDLRFAREEPEQHAGQADRLLAQRHAYVSIAAARRIALVEQEVDHRGDGRESFGPLHRAGGLVGNVGCRNSPLRPCDALLHGALAHQEGARDLLDREAGDDAQRQRDLLGGGQVRMAADEQEPQHVVAIMRIVEPLGQRRFGVVEIRNEFVGRQRFLAVPAAHLVERGVAPDQDEPGGGIARRAVLRPVLQRPQARFLKGLLRSIEVAEIAQQRSDRLGTCGGQRRIEPGEIAHAPPLPK
jgi:hypothetical protein